MKSKKILWLFLIIALIVTLCSCTDQGLRGGCLSDEIITEDLPQIRCGYMSDKTTFEITDVTLTFCYGVAGPYRSDNYFNSYAANKAVIQFRAKGKKVYECKTMDISLATEKYEMYKDKKGVFEDFTIPAEVFNEETGSLTFDVIQYGMSEGETEWKELERGIAPIFYKKIDQNTIKLSNKPFD